MATIDSRYLSRGTRFSILDSVGYQPSSTIETNTPASLVLDFLDDKHVDDWSKVTFTRTSPATYFDKDGVLKVMGYNLILNSDDITHSSWLKTQAGTGLAPVVTLNAGVAPDGTMSATRLVLDKGAGTLTTDQSQISANGDSGMTAGLFSVWMKSNTASTYNVRIGNVGPRLCSVTTTWQQFTTTTSTETNARITLRGTMSTSDYADILVWHPQHETGVTVPSTYSSTTSVANSAARINYDPATPAGVTGGELVVNGDFSNGTTAWVGNNANIAIVSGAIQVTNTGSFGSARQTVTVTPGKTYRVSFSYRSVDGNSCAMYLRWIGFEDSTGQYMSTTSSTTLTTVTVNLVAQSNTLHIRATANLVSGSCVAEFDNISVQEVTFAPKGLLVEEARTNLALNSQDLTAASWQLAQSAIAATSFVAPDGQTYTKGKLNETAVNNTHAVGTLSSLVVSASSPATITAFVKAGERNFCTLQINDATSSNAAYCTFNLTTGAVVTNPTMLVGTLTAMTADSTYAGGGWWRVRLTVTLNIVANVIGYVGVLADGVNRSYLGVANSGIYVWGIQIEAAATPSSYIPTTGSNGIRTLDNPSITSTNFSSFWNNTSGTFFVEYDYIGSLPSGGFNKVLVTGLPSGGNNRYELRGVVTSGSAAHHAVGTGASVANLLSPQTVSLNTVQRVASTYGSSGAAITAGGMTPVTDSTPSSVSGLTSLDIGGGNNAATVLNGHIRKIIYYPTRLPNAMLKSMTKTDYEVVPSLVIDFTNNVYMS